MSEIERERTKEINKELAPTAFELAWHAFQHTGIDLVADSDDETCKCLHNAIVAYLAATGRDTVAATPQREEIANKLDEIARKRGAVYLGEICTLAMAEAILALFAKER